MFQLTKGLTGGVLLMGTLLVGGSGLFIGGHEIARAGTASAPSAAVSQPLLKLRKALKLRAQVLTVTAVNGSSIATTTRDGGALTVITSSATTFSEAGGTVSLTAVQPSEHLLVQGTRDRTAHTIQAKKVVIVVPSVSGVVTNVAGATITMTAQNAVQHTFNIGSARITQAGQPATLQAITVGSAIVVQGTGGSDGTFTVIRVAIRQPQFAGVIASVNGTSFTMRTVQGTVYTVTPAPSATYVVRQRGVAAKPSTIAPALTVGERVRAVGSLAANSSTVTATRITLAPAVKKPAASTLNS